MTDLRDLLDRASADAGDPTPGGTHAAADLARGRTALRRRRTLRTGLVGLAAAAVVAAGVGGTALLGDAPTSDPSVIGASTGPTDGLESNTAIRLVAAQLDAGPYTIGKVPDGWKVQGESPYAVTIAPTDGSVDTNPDSFVGKLVVLYDQNPISGTKIAFNGRVFHQRGDSGHTSISVETRDGEPEGVVTVQYPDDTWPRELMLEFADAVVVNDSAQPGVG